MECAHTKPGTFLRLDLIPEYYAQGMCCRHGYITQRDLDYWKLVTAPYKTFSEIRRDVSSIRVAPVLDAYCTLTGEDVETVGEELTNAEIARAETAE